MRLKMVVAGALCAVALTACGSVPGLTAPLASPSVSLAVAKTEYGFEKIYETAGNAYKAWLKVGAPDPAVKAKVKGYMAQGKLLVDAARKAQALGDADGVIAETAALKALMDQVLKLTTGAGR